MPKILITGANSFIGTNFREKSRFKEIDEVSLYDFKPEAIDFSGYDTVLHLAAIVHKSNKIPESEYFLINRDLTTRVAENAKKAGVRQFIFLSSIKVYGRFNPGSNPWNEDSACNPEDAYGRSKYQAELALSKLGDNDFAVSIIRTPIVYGPGVKANMLKFIRLIERMPVLPFAGVKNTRYYTFVENLVSFIDRIAELKIAGIFIAMDDKPFSTSDLVINLAKLLNKELYLFRLPGFIIRIGVLVYPVLFERLYGSIKLDNHKTNELLDFKPQFTTIDGLKKTILNYMNEKEHKY